MQYYADSDINGNVTGYYNDDIHTTIPATAIPITAAQWQDSVANSGKYIVQNKQFVLAPPLTAAQLLSQAQQSKIAQLEASCASTLNGGFQSSALGTAHTYASDDTAQKNFASEFAYLNSSLNTDTTVMWNTKESGYTSHTIAQFNQVYKDGRAFQQTNWTKLFNLIGQVQAATTVDQVNAIAW